MSNYSLSLSLCFPLFFFLSQHKRALIKVIARIKIETPPVRASWRSIYGDRFAENEGVAARKA